jgi:hypothetical protein
MPPSGSFIKKKPPCKVEAMASELENRSKPGFPFLLPGLRQYTPRAEDSGE